ncbi:hypothetical protein Bca4012_047186 [Brassica carinata]
MDPPQVGSCILSFRKCLAAEETVVAELAASALVAEGKVYTLITFFLNCKMYPDLGFSGETTTTETLVLGVAPAMNSQYEASGETFVAENDACKCGSDCKCNPCTCK